MNCDCNCKSNHRTKTNIIKLVRTIIENSKKIIPSKPKKLREVERKSRENVYKSLNESLEKSKGKSRNVQNKSLEKSKAKVEKCPKSLETSKS